MRAVTRPFGMRMLMIWTCRGREPRLMIWIWRGRARLMIFSRPGV